MSAPVMRGDYRAEQLKDGSFRYHAVIELVRDGAPFHVMRKSFRTVPAALAWPRDIKQMHARAHP